MKAKKEYILLAIVIIAVSLYLFSRNENKTHYQLPNIPVVDKKAITKIEISKADTAVILNKTDSKWLILPEGYPADTGKVESMLEVIEEFELETLVSEQKSDHLFDLTEDKKSTIRVWADDRLQLDFEMGRPAPSWNHTFVRMADDIRVYHAKGNFKSTFDLTVDTLRDKTVLSFEQNEIEGMEIIKGKETLVLAKKTTPPEPTDQAEGNGNAPAAPPAPKIGWETPDGQQAEESVINGMLSALTKLKCERYSDEQKKDSFTNPVYTVKMKGAQEYSLALFEKTDSEDKSRPATSSENDYPFLLSDSQADGIMKSQDEIIEKKVISN